jgi:hypothetical protein
MDSKRRCLTVSPEKKEKPIGMLGSVLSHPLQRHVSCHLRCLLAGRCFIQYMSTFGPDCNKTTVLGSRESWCSEKKKARWTVHNEDHTQVHFFQRPVCRQPIAELGKEIQWGFIYTLIPSGLRVRTNTGVAWASKSQDADINFPFPVRQGVDLGKASEDTQILLTQQPGNATLTHNTHA